jgi:hypothetical protein
VLDLASLLIEDDWVDVGLGKAEQKENEVQIICRDSIGSIHIGHNIMMDPTLYME